MTKESTMDRLHQMRMSVMARAYREQEEAPGVEEMTFDERFAMLVDAEWDSRRSNKRVRLLRAAGLAEPGANVADVRYDADRKLDKGQIRELANCSWIRDRRNLVITGASGAGKTWMGVRAGRGRMQQLLHGSLREAAGDAGRPLRREERGVAQAQEALHQVRPADYRRLAAGKRQGQRDARDPRGDRGQVQDQLNHALLAVRSWRMAREARQGRRRRRGD